MLVRFAVYDSHTCHTPTKPSLRFESGRATAVKGMTFGTSARLNTSILSCSSPGKCSTNDRLRWTVRVKPFLINVDPAGVVCVFAYSNRLFLFTSCNLGRVYAQKFLHIVTSQPLVRALSLHRYQQATCSS
eukprot:m.37919 g.37919  ORF g.37919 m.37919 type:complete len:131 (-) comp16371_c0_seq1:397-789(-)